MLRWAVHALGSTWNLPGSFHIDAIPRTKNHPYQIPFVPETIRTSCQAFPLEASQLFNYLITQSTNLRIPQSANLAANQPELSSALPPSPAQHQALDNKDGLTIPHHSTAHWAAPVHVGYEVTTASLQTRAY